MACNPLIKQLFSNSVAARVWSPAKHVSVLGPTEFAEAVAQAGQGEADDVVIAAFNSGNVASGATLDGVGAGFIEGFFGREIASELFGGERGEMDVGGFDETAALGIGKANDGYAGYDGVGVAGESGEHLMGVVVGAGLAEDFAVDEDGGVGGDDDCRTDGAGGDQLGFGVGEALHKVLGGFAGNGSFVDGRRKNREGETGIAKDSRAARGSGSEDELCSGHDAARILHAGRGNSLCVGAGDNFREGLTTDGRRTAREDLD